MKTCIKCNIEKSKDLFHTDKLRSDGLFPYCKSCRKIPRTPAKSRCIEQVLSEFSISINGCWEWTGTLTRDGYGVSCYKGKRGLAHRLSYENAKGKITDDLLVLHKCDNRKCINPDHLYTGTNLDNSNDMVERNRSNAPFGEGHSLSKLTEDQVLSIRTDKRKHKEISLEFGVSPSSISGIKTRRLWAHL